jgi:hypothetical protein
MSRYPVAEEIMSICADYLVELRGFELMAIGRCYTSHSSLTVFFSTWAHTRHAAQDGRAIEWPIERAAYSRRGLPRRISQYLCGRAARPRPAQNGRNIR